MGFEKRKRDNERIMPERSSETEDSESSEMPFIPAYLARLVTGVESNLFVGEEEYKRRFKVLFTKKVERV